MGNGKPSQNRARKGDLMGGTIRFHQLSPRTSKRSKGYRYWIKRWQNRAERRAAKANPENAQRRHAYHGVD